MSFVQIRLSSEKTRILANAIKKKKKIKSKLGEHFLFHGTYSQKVHPVSLIARHNNGILTISRVTVYIFNCGF